MKIVVTGSAGFIGSELCKTLKRKGHQVIGLDIKEGNDILTCELPRADWVIHLAANAGVLPSIEDPKKYWMNNVEGTKRILASYPNSRVLVAGSSSQYEPHLNPYAASKHVIESIPHTNVCFMRFHTVYSNPARPGMFFDKLQRGVLEFVTDHERDFIHITDVVEAIHLLLYSTHRGPIDIGTGKPVKVSSIAPHLPVKEGQPYERLRTCANKKDIELLEAMGWRCKVTVNDFLNEV
jgi:nucleoside-diphosphate-sugar epimerase